MKQVKIAPSILAADFARLGEEAQAVEQAGADRLHLDIMDGRFVPNISFGPVVVRALHQVTRLPLEAHLMIAEPERYLTEFAQAGAGTIIVHQEASLHLERTLSQIKALGLRAGAALNPATPLVLLEEVIAKLDLLLIMTVNPGFGGQKFITSMLSKIERARALLAKDSLSCELEVDGGINAQTASRAAAAGAEVLV
ncbi:MAG TPA: ribulose-phosphate 3-epimerase, partial [Candidatus Fraserbacteria bacterium]|nr:ribulose-phosphate 3-epimerase [Candidatus Fraserbacteria bacterium]